MVTTTDDSVTVFSVSRLTLSSSATLNDNMVAEQASENSSPVCPGFLSFRSTIGMRGPPSVTLPKDEILKKKKRRKFNIFFEKRKHGSPVDSRNYCGCSITLTGCDGVKTLSFVRRAAFSGE